MSISLEEGFAYVCLYFVLLQATVCSRTTVKAVWDRWARANPLLWMYAAWVGTSAIINAVVLGNLDGLHSLKDMLPGLVLYTCMITWVDSDERLDHAHRAVLGMLVVLAFMGLSQQVVAWPYPNEVDPNTYFKHTLQGVDLVRHPVVGTLGHPNAFAVFIGPLSVLSIGWLTRDVRDSGWRGAGLLAIPVTLLLLVGVVLTQVKATGTIAIFGAIVCVVAIGWRMRYRASRGLALLAGMVIVAAIALVIMAYMGDRLPGGLALDTMAQRLALNYEALDLIRSSPWIGVLGGAVQRFSDTSSYNLGVHNEYIKQMLQAGGLGAVLFLGMLLWPLWRRGEDAWLYATPVVVLAVTLLVEAATGNQLQSMVFLVLGLAEAKRLRAEASVRTSDQPC